MPKSLAGLRGRVQRLGAALRAAGCAECRARAASIPVIDVHSIEALLALPAPATETCSSCRGTYTQRRIVDVLLSEGDCQVGAVACGR